MRPTSARERSATLNFGRRPRRRGRRLRVEDGAHAAPWPRPRRSSPGVLAADRVTGTLPARMRGHRRRLRVSQPTASRVKAGSRRAGSGRGPGQRVGARVLEGGGGRDEEREEGRVPYAPPGLVLEDPAPSARSSRTCAVRARGGHRVVRVGQGDELDRERNLRCRGGRRGSRSRRSARGAGGRTGGTARAPGRPSGD